MYLEGAITQIHHRFGSTCSLVTNQINVLKSEWKRPYAYNIDASGCESVNGEDLIRILKADWNHLLNELDGIDRKLESKMDDMTHCDVSFHLLGQVRKPHWNGSWDHAKIRNLSVVSPSVDRSNDCSNALVHWLWRRAFGTFDMTQKNF
jgi:hypothetical protein